MLMSSKVAQKFSQEDDEITRTSYFVIHAKYIRMCNKFKYAFNFQDIAGADIVTDFGIICLLFEDPEQIFVECW